MPGAGESPVPRSRVIVAQMGARMHYAVARALHERALLERLYTDVCASKGLARLVNLIPRQFAPAAVRRLQGRIPPGVPPQRTTAFTGFGIEYLRRRSAARGLSEQLQAHLWAGQRFCELILASGLPEAAGAVYGFNSACEALLHAAKCRGMHTLVEQTIAPLSVERRLLEEDAHFHHGWGGGECSVEAELFAARERREWALADSVVCPSEFVRSGVVAEGVAPERCLVVPYGVQRPRVASGPPSGYGSRRSGLRVLFVGTVGLRKGVPYLFDAMRRVRSSGATCRIVGPWDADAAVLRDCCPPNVELVGAIPRNDVAREFARADVFCLPSLCEGSATVILEALAAGLPVITTPNAGSIVRDGIDGYVLPIRDSEAIAEAIDSLADPDVRARMSAGARERSDFGSIESYAARVVQVFSPDPERREMPS